MAYKLTPEVQRKLVQAIKLGATYPLAAQYAGICRATLYNWRKKGEEAKSGKFRELYEAMQAAEGEAAVKWLATIEKAAQDGNWQAGAWKLERRYPDDFGRQRLDVNSDNKVEIRVVRSDNDT